MVKHKSGPSEWVTKMLALIRSGNSAAAIAQIKAAPSAKDVGQLRTLLQLPNAPARHANVDTAINEQVVALASPRLHRAP
ncbi:hypothetical protein [Rhodoferax sp.]|uniref:hypothetical protein n=1 Tax=Rhodoferax sp. TaxID=50421 RepID=UPI00374D03D3